MTKILDKITLDLSRDELLGFERWKDAGTVMEYIGKNFNGEKPPLVEIVEKGGIYQLVYDKNGRYGIKCGYDNYGGGA